MKVKNNAGKVIEVTKTAFDLLYKKRGFTPYAPSKKTTSSKKTSNSSTKKVNGNDDKSDGSK
ncbi:hypothetical protein [Gracilibacillus saliphilus]|uniref:hypothetical protein n=1 Tax=Gracilibacillus saliphilus TaxID=543890 RepID=UPI0013D611DA|nr:hypothetical protein [Gracilibacillus saliphilus]